MQGSGRIRQISSVGAIAIGITTLVAMPALLRNDDPPLPRPEMTLSDYLPVADDEGIEYEYTEVPGSDEILTSIGTSEGNLVATVADSSYDDLAEVVIYDDSGEVVTFDQVRGIALSDPAGTLSAWVEVADTPDGPSSTVVAVDASTGEELGRVPVEDEVNVTAVRDGTVAITDGYGMNQLWTVGSSPQPVPFVPDDSFIVGLTGSRIVAVDHDYVTTVYDRENGAEIVTFTDMTQWDTNVDGDLLVGATDQGEARQVTLDTGASTLIDASIDAGTASFSEDDSVVLQAETSFSEPADTYTVNICPPGEPCQEIETDGTPYLPNDVIGQIVSQSE